MNLRRVSGSVLAGFLGFIAASGSAALARTPGTITYRIQVKNVTASNVLSPFIASVSPSDLQIAPLGATASPGIARLAETGDRSILTEELNTAMVAQVIGADGGAIQPGETRSVDISVPVSLVHSGAKLDVFAMIGRSNDSFITLGGLPLARIGTQAGSTVTLFARNYDAGSEENSGNTEDFGPAGHPTEGAEGKISFDRGLNPRGNAPEVFSWGTTAAVVSVTRLN